MRKTIFFAGFILLLLFLFNIYFYFVLPNNIVINWNKFGEPNGYIEKFKGLFILPLITLIIFLIFLFIPKIDPLKKNYSKFRNYYDSFILILVIFIFYFNILIILYNLKFFFNFVIAIIPALSFLFIYMGIILKNIKQNWFIGIRTPWTLSSTIVWNKTHNLGSFLFIISGLISLIGILFPKKIFWFVLAPIIISVIILIIYSYIEYARVKK
ncbi:MAG: SdpI family protein [Candidatus Pacearchaeota archaeon]